MGGRCQSARLSEKTRSREAIKGDCPVFHPSTLPLTLPSGGCREGLSPAWILQGLMGLGRLLNFYPGILQSWFPGDDWTRGWYAEGTGWGFTPVVYIRVQPRWHLVPEYPRWLLEPRPTVLLSWPTACMRPRGWQLSLLLFKHPARFVELCVCQNSPGFCFSCSVGRSRDVLMAELGNSTLRQPCTVPGSCLLSLVKSYTIQWRVFGELWANVIYSCQCLQHFCLSRHSASHWQLLCDGSLLDKGQRRWWVQFLAQIWCAHTSASCCDKDFPPPG